MISLVMKSVFQDGATDQNRNLYGQKESTSASRKTVENLLNIAIGQMCFRFNKNETLQKKFGIGRITEPIVHNL